MTLSPIGKELERLIIEELDWTKLSSRGQAIVRLIALPICWGWSQRELAGLYGRSEDWIVGRLKELRREIVELMLRPSSPLIRRREEASAAGFDDPTASR